MLYYHLLRSKVLLEDLRLFLQLTVGFSHYSSLGDKETTKTQGCDGQKYVKFFRWLVITLLLVIIALLAAIYMDLDSKFVFVIEKLDLIAKDQQYGFSDLRKHIIEVQDQVGVIRQKTEEEQRVARQFLEDYKKEFSEKVDKIVGSIQAMARRVERATKPILNALARQEAADRKNRSRGSPVVAPQESNQYQSTSPDKRQQEYNSWLSKGISSLGVQNYTLAKYYFGKAISLDGRPLALAYHALANSLENPEDPDTQQAIIQRATLAAKDTEAKPIAYHALANIFKAKKAYKAALEYYEKILEIQPKDAEALFGMGQIYFNMRDYPKAIDHLARSIRIKENPAARKMLEAIKTENARKKK